MKRAWRLARSGCAMSLMFLCACNELVESIGSTFSEPGRVVIESVKGDSSTQPGRVENGLIIEGLGFGQQPTVTLVSGSRTAVLQVTNMANDKFVHVSLPAELRAELGGATLSGEVQLRTASNALAKMGVDLAWQESPATLPVAAATPASIPADTKVSEAATEATTPTGSAAQGHLPGDVIQKVMLRNRNSLRYCYEHELVSNKNLSGTINTQFVIGATGTVTMSVIKNSTMKNAAVETCIAQQLRRLTFPKPEGGGVVIVNYPFIFKHQ